MQFRIADTFTASLSKLPNENQRAAKTTAFDLQTNLAHPSLSLHRLTGASDPNFWSARVNLDLRIILHRAGENVVLCYVGRHDDAYRWAERRTLETHPTTGAAQLVELREVVQEIPVPYYVETEVQAPPKPLLFTQLLDDQLLGYGVPVEWLEEVRAADEDSVLDLTDHLPSEAAEALLELAVGKTPQPSLPAPSGADPFSHPDALRRFRVMRNVEELAEALEYHWEKWTIFLHPAQLSLVERNYNGPARVSGSAGTGKTVVALHRAAYLAKSNPGSRVLLTTFSDALANLLRSKRVCDKVQSGWLEPFEHQVDHRYMNPGLTGFWQFLVVLAEPSAPAEPGQRAFNHPSARQHLELVAGRSPAHHLQQPSSSLPSPRHQPTGIGRIGPDDFKPGEPAQQLGQHQFGPVPVLDVGGVNDHGQEQPGGVHYNVALAPGHLFAGVVAARPPFSVVLTDWLSMIAPLGVASRPSLSRTTGRSASKTRSQVPFLRHFRKYHQTVPQGGRSWGIIRQEIPPRNTYRMPFTTSRRCTVRGCPLSETVGNRGSSKPHWASVKSVGYDLRSIPQSYRLPANHTKLFQCKFRQLSHTL